MRRRGLIVRERPPNYPAIIAALGKPPYGTVFAYGDRIYAPDGVDLPPDLIVHELVHFRQQKQVGGPSEWWRLYLADPRFRYEQELEAYREQVASIPDRASRRQCARNVAKSLASGMYGRIVSRQAALAAVTE